MSTFDGWEAQLYGDVLALPGQSSEDELMHFRTKGSKNGVRRYQTESGEWTPLGLKERAAREGWGKHRAERKAARKERREARMEVRNDRRAARSARRSAAVAALKEKRRQNDVKQLTDAELKKRIERAKMEQEYRELSKSSARKFGEKFVVDFLENRAKNAQRKYEEKQKAVEYAREMQKLKETTKQKEIQAKSDEKKYEAEKARADADKTRADTDAKDIAAGTRKLSIKKEMKNLKLQNKRFKSDNTILGGIRKKVNAISTARGAGRAEMIQERAFVSGVLRGKKRVDNYNNKLRSKYGPGADSKGAGYLGYDPNAWDRDKNRKKSNNEQKKKGKG